MLPASALIMFLFGVIVIYGGLAYFLYRAFKGKTK